MAAGLMFAAAGCGGDDDSSGGDDQTTEESTADSTSSEASDTETDTGSDEASAEGLCVAVTSVDLTAAFNGELQFGEASDVTGRELCLVPIVGAEGEGLVASVKTAENYELKAEYEDQGLPFEQIDGLGEEAFILNEADLNVLLADGSAISVGLSAVWLSGSPPDPSVVEAGLIEVAEAIIASR
jgi:hypothetical protein